METEAVLLRRARPEDVLRISALARWVWLDRYAIDGGVNDDVAAYLKREFDEQLLGQTFDLGRHLLMERGNALLAWAQLDDAAACPLGGDGAGVELRRIYVSPRSQGQGLGARLLRQCRQEWSGRPLWLSVWVGNEDALRFYRREGAAFWGETSFELGGKQHRNDLLRWSALERLE